MDFRISQEQKLILETVRDFVRTELMPLEEDLQKAELEGWGHAFPREETTKDESRRHMEGDIASASARYSIALGEQYNVRDPYGSLARAAMQEYAMFHRRQEQMRDEIAKEKDPGKRREIELKREIEGCDYMAITSERLSGMSAVITGRENAPQAVLDRERAAAYQDRGRELREVRSRASGLRLVEGLARQIRGKFEVTRTPSRCSLHFRRGDL